METASFNNIFIFVPNIIGYVRILFGILSFACTPSHYALASCFYVTSALLDAVDGFTARILNQGTMFGAILDQLTDRCMFIGLLMHLAVFYPKWKLWFVLIAMLDVSSHWIYLHACTLSGLRSHKSGSSNAILNKYYTNKWVLFGMCAANELHFISLYLLNFTTQPYISLIIVVVTTPPMVAKCGINLIHIYEASLMLAELDN